MFDAQWETRDAPLRGLIAERVTAFSPASVLEVGCGVGANLHNIDAPETAGIDISEAAIEYARSKLPGCHLQSGPAHKLPYDTDSFDVVFTCGLLVCIGPDRATEVLRELLRTSRGVVLLAEGGAPEGRVDWNNGETTYWRRDYERALRELNVSTSIEPIPSDAVVGHVDTLTTARI